MIVVPIYCILSVRLQTSETIASGIVYNNQNNSIFTGNTYFRIRASENTIVTGENISRFCLPPNSPYIKATGAFHIEFTGLISLPNFS